MWWIIGSIVGYICVGSIIAGIESSFDSDDAYNKSAREKEDATAFRFCLGLLWPIFLIALMIWCMGELSMMATNKLRGVARNGQVKRTKKKTMDMKKVRIELETAKKELKEEQEAIEELEKELKQDRLEVG